MKINDNQVKEVVKDWFTKKAADEWRRLQRNPYRQIEFIVTMHFLEKYLPDYGLLLDAGGGPSRYTMNWQNRATKLFYWTLFQKCSNLPEGK